MRGPRPVGGRREGSTTNLTVLTHFNTVTKPSGKLTRSGKNQWSWAYWSRDIIPALGVEAEGAEIQGCFQPR